MSELVHQQEQEQRQQMQERETSNTESKGSSVLFSPRVDIVETPEEVVLYGDLPGVQSEDLDIQFEDGELRIHGRVAPRYPQARFLRREYSVGHFFRSFTIGELIDTQQISAELKHGVLTVRLPKAESAKPRKIEVKTA